ARLWSSDSCDGSSFMTVIRVGPRPHKSSHFRTDGHPLMRILAIPCRTIANMTLTVSRRTRAKAMRVGVAAVGTGSHDHSGLKGPAMQAAIRRKLARAGVTNLPTDGVKAFVTHLAGDQTTIPAVGDSGGNCVIFSARTAALCGHNV